MNHNDNTKNLLPVRGAISAPRLQTYENAVGKTLERGPEALELYMWNAKISGAMLTQLHICEVVVRNAVSEALSNVYGPEWPWNTTFVHSLPTARSTNYSQKLDLLRTRERFNTTGKVIPELKFVFWQKMFTKRNDVRIWEPHLKAVFPNMDDIKPVADLRISIYDHLEQIRRLRNRIAHHEPIFMRSLEDDYEKAFDLVFYRCQATADWMLNNGAEITTLFRQRPAALNNDTATVK